MKMTFCGAARMVTGSCCLVETETARFLVDCGMLQGQDAEANGNCQDFPFDPKSIDFVLLTHAHIDHSGRLPKLYVDGFRGPVHTTRATAGLCRIMLPDSGHIQESEAAWHARKDRRADRECAGPLYTMQDAIDTCRLLTEVRYDEPFSPADGIRVCMRDAGHILGSAILEVDITEGGRTTRVVFSGDLGNRNIPIMRDPAIIESADLLVVESTYGDRLHEALADPVERMVTVINETIARGGNVIIPAFAVGRTQEVIYALNREEERYRDHRSAFLRTQVYVDSPLAVSATRVFEENSDCFDEEAQAFIKAGENPLEFPNLHFTASVEESKALNDDSKPKIIISSSGMADAGRVRHHLKHNLWKREAAVIFVGYQAPGTLGRQLVDGATRVSIFDEEIAVRAHVEMIEGFSGHADRRGLLNWIDAFKRKPTRIILVHGEDGVIDRFAGTIGGTLGIPTHIADFGVAIQPDDASLFTVAEPLPEPAAEPGARFGTGLYPHPAPAGHAEPAAQRQRSLPVQADKAVKALEDDFARILAQTSRSLARCRTPEEKAAVLAEARQSLRQAVDAELDGKHPITR